MENVRFKLKTFQKDVKPAQQEPTLVSLFFSYGYCTYSDNGKKVYTPLVYSTGLKIKPHQWNNKTYRAKQTSNFDYQSFNTVIDNIEATIKKLYRENKTATPKQLKELLNAEMNPNNNRTDATTLNKYIDKYIKDIETGNKKTIKGTNYKKGTVKTYKNFKVTFANYQKEVRKQYDFNDINIDFYNSYTNYLSNNGSNPNTVGKHIKTLKTIMRDARELKLHNNTEIDNKAFKIIKQEVENIYLSEKEIKAIYNLDLSDNKHLDIARDVFLVGCYTAQRYSDYSKINKNNIKEYNNIKYIELTQKKTGDKAIIPIRAELNKILKKYNYNLPKTYNQKVNQYIKEVCKIAEIDTPIQTTIYKNGLTANMDVLKYHLVTTHTARRSGATNMYLAGIPAIDIMKITSHKTQTSFLSYIKVTKQQTAESLHLHPYFNNMIAQ
jgi:hypothetical protein